MSAVDWTGIVGTAGPAGEIPVALVAAARGEDAAGDEALGDLLGLVCHQGVLERAAPEVATWLLRATGIVGQPGPWSLLSGVEYLVSCAWAQPREFGFLPRRTGFGGAAAPSAGAAARAQAAYDELSARLLQHVESEAPALLGLLAHADPRTRGMAGRLLACCRGEDRRALLALEGALEREVDETVRAGLTVALAWLSARDGAPAGPLVAGSRLALASSDGITQAGALVALLLLEPRECLRCREEQVRRGLRFDAAGVDPVRFPWSLGLVVDLVAAALVRSDAPDEQVIELLLDALVGWVAASPEPGGPVEWRAQDVLLARLVPRVFPRALGRREYLDHEELSTSQRSVLARLVPYPPPALKAHALTAVGVRNLWRDADRLLGLASGGLDARMDGTWEEMPVRWPLWKWWHQAALVDRWRGPDHVTSARDLVLDAMERNLSPEAVFRAAEDAAAGAYDVPHAPLVRRVEALADRIPEVLGAYVDGLREPSGPQAALAVIPSLALASSRPVPWLDRTIAWIERVTPAALARQARDMSGALRAGPGAPPR